MINICDTAWVCENCTDTLICNTCSEKGISSSTDHLIRPCLSCYKSNKKCVRALVVVEIQDCASINKKVMDKINVEFAKDVKDKEPLFKRLIVRAMPDVIHCIKNGKGSDSNWELSVEGDKSNLSQFRSARDDPGPIGDRLRKLISQADVINRDRMCSSAPRNLSQPKVAEVMREVDRVVVSLSPEIYLPTKDNCEGTIVSPLAISDGGISHVFVLNTSSEVFEIRLH